MVQRVLHHIENYRRALLRGFVQWGFVVFAIQAASSLFAQPQAPVVWGEGRWLGFPHSFEPPFDSARIQAQGVELMGDTLVYCFQASALSGRGGYTGRSVDNGLTHSEWQLLTPDPVGGANLSVCGSEGHVMCTRNNFVGPATSWMQRSTDCGITWGPVQDLHSGRSYVEVLASGTSMFRVFRVDCTAYAVDRFSRSSDGGMTWSEDLTADTAHLEQGSLCRTRTHIVREALPSISDSSYQVQIAIGENLGESWSSFAPIPGQSYDSLAFSSVAMAGDTGSETVLILTFEQATQGPYSGYNACLYRSVDGGNTWQPRTRMNDSVLVSYFCYPGVFCRGKLCAITWAGIRPNSSLETIWWRFSANHGKTWYPEQAVASDSITVVLGYGQFIGRQVRLYWRAWTDHTLIQQDHGTATGDISPDTLAPVINMVVPLGDEIPPGSQVEFLATASDNDSLLHLDAVLKRHGAADSIVVPLSERVSPTDYRGTWQVPNDTTLWTYYYRAEDMWENVSVYPDTGAFTFHTTGWSRADAIGPYGPASFSVSVFPNPSNGWPSIQLSPDWFANGAVTAAVYNVLGQKVWDEVLSVRTGTACRAPTAEVSGVYVLKVSNQTRSRLQKFVVLK